MNAAAAKANLTDLFHSLFECAFEDWNTMLGFEARVERGHLVSLRGREVVAAAIGHDVVAETRVEGNADGPIHFVFSRGLIAGALTQALMLPHSEGVPELDETNAAQVEGMQELMNLFCGSSTRALEQRDKKLRVSQSVEDLVVSVGGSPEFADNCRIIATKFLVRSGGHAHRVLCLVNEELARAF